jgi:FkbH-like protein
MEKLHSRGILLAICSKNDPVERSLIPELIGRELFENVVSVNLTWQPKSQILRDIAEELNIGLDSLAFFDDSPFERAEVAANAPEVMVFGPEHLFGCLNRPAFEQPGRMTQESLTRTAKYKQQSKRKEAEKSSGTGLLEFLTSCQLKLELLTPSGADLGRVFELLQRTNQLNATLKRTSLEELKKQSEDSQQYQMMIARLRDKFGDYGLIGFASFKKSRECWQILDFAFSCRSAGRGVEQAILSEASRMARDEGSSAIIIDFCPGPRNQQMFEILKGCGFSGLNGERLEEGISIRLEYVPTPDQSISFPQWIELISP